MKNLIKITIIVIIANLTISAQVSKDSWSFGFGGAYPRLVGITNPSNSSVNGYGAFISLKRNFSEHTALRFGLNYNHMESDYTVNRNIETHQLNLFAGDLNLLYYFSPCEVVTPYGSFGFGAIVFTNENSPENYDDTYAAYQFNVGLGAEWKISECWNIVTEFSHHTASTNDLDGRDDLTNKGLFGSTADSYMKLNLGLVYYFSKGEPSKLCDLYDGISIPQPEKIDYTKVEEIVKKYVPEEKDDIIVAQPPAPEAHWVLVGVNFDFNSARITKESYPVLFYTFQVLQNNPEMQVEVQGYTDSIGKEETNMKISEKRARVVKEYLVSKGIDSSRLTAKGYGEQNPIADNSTPEGRAINRRIEFEILNK